MAKYKHNHLLFLSNPLVEPDSNLCERKARVLKGENQPGHFPAQLWASDLFLRMPERTWSICNRQRKQPL